MDRNSIFMRIVLALFFALIAAWIAAGAMLFLGPYQGGGAGTGQSETGETGEGSGTMPGENEASRSDAQSGEAGGISDEDALERSRSLTDRYRNFNRKSGSGTESRGEGYGPGYPGSENLPEPTDSSLVWIASDIHYCSPTMTDYGEAFRERLDEDDGKDEEDIETILDTWIDEILEARPATVILSGDLALDGETENHKALAEKLKRLTDDGIQPLVIPGNHDIGCYNWSASYHGDQKVSEPTPESAAEFREIYHAFGYDQASSSDAASLSYCYHVDDKHWFLMLDSAIYEPETEVGGRIREETLTWMEEVLQSAQEAGAIVIPVAHHNLLSQSRLYRENCTLENNDAVTALLEKYQVPLFFSGHLHLQRIREYKPEPGLSAEWPLWEVVSGCFAMTPFPYGELRFEEDGTLTYEQKTVGVSEAVHQNGLDEFRGVITRQVESLIRGLPGYISANMADSYASLLEDYVAGRIVDEKEYRSELGYRMMQTYLSGSEVLDKVEWMLKDTKTDGTRLTIVPSGEETCDTSSCSDPPDAARQPALSGT